MYRYETHLHTFPVSRDERPECYKIRGVTGYLSPTALIGGGMILFCMINEEGEGWHEQSI